MPVKQLKGFRRVSLMPGESKRIEFTLNSDAFSYYDVREGKWVVHPGKYDVMIGSSSRDIRLEVSLDLR
jgi:beta-glucosidase